MSQIWSLREILRPAAVSTWVVIAVLSTVPLRDRLPTGTTGTVAQFLGYCLAAAVTRAAFPHIQSRWQIIAFSLAAALFEIYQIWRPGRSASLGMWLASSVGAAVGVVLVRTILHEHLI